MTANTRPAPARRRVREAPPAPEQTSITNMELARVVQSEGSSTPREMLLAKRLEGAMGTAEELDQEREALQAEIKRLEGALELQQEENRSLRAANTEMGYKLAAKRRECEALKRETEEA